MTQQSKVQGKNLIFFPQFQHEGETQTNSAFTQYNLDVSKDSLWYIANTHPMSRIHLPYVQELGEFKARKHYMTMRTHLPSFLLKITLDGEGYLKYNDSEYFIGKNEFFLIDCRQPHYYATSPQTEFWHVVWIHFWGGRDMQAYYNCFLEANGGIPKGKLKSLESLSIIRSLIESYSSNFCMDYPTDIRAASQISTLLANCVLSVMEGRDNPALQTPPQFISEIQNYIIEHFDEKITLDDLAEKFYVNKFYLHKQFRLYLNTTPCELQRNLRINKAKVLLRMTTLSIEDIAESLGFNSASYFISSFRRQEGKTPLQYRQEWGT